MKKYFLHWLTYFVRNSKGDWQVKKPADFAAITYLAPINTHPWDVYEAKSVVRFPGSLVVTIYPKYISWAQNLWKIWA